MFREPGWVGSLQAEETSMKDVTWTVGNLGEKMEVNVKHLETNMAAGFRNERIQRKDDHFDLEATK